jgi:tetratricopeptide (TPR) repeat protein
LAPRYSAFLSYSHSDKAVAAWLHRTLETYRVPSKLVGLTTALGVTPARLAPIFRDRDELSASADLGGAITAALKASQFLVVICSPGATRSHWVNQEILTFKRMHGEDRIFALIADGEPFASNSPATADQECFPAALRFRLGSDGELSEEPAEPIAADIRPGGDGKRLAKLKLAAGLLGVELDALVQRETQRRIRRMALVASAAVVGMIFSVGLALYANASRIEANEQRQVAEREAATARAASDYLVDTFRLADPASENPRTITALTILDRSAERARTELADQPVVQARLVSTLGDVYNNLGLPNEAAAAVLGSASSIAKAGPDGANAQLTLAATYLMLGRFDQAMARVSLAKTALGPDEAERSSVRGRAAVTEGMIHAAEGRTAEGIAAFDRAIAIYRATPSVAPAKLATALQARGALLSDDGQFAKAETSLAEALKIYRGALGDRHVAIGQTWFALAQNAFLSGDLALAETRIANALSIERQVLEPDNTIIADALSMQGQIYQGQKRLTEAQRSLQQAVTIYRKAFGGPHYLIGIAEVYLALVESERGRTAAALRILDDAKHNYDVSYGKLHANHGDLLVNRAAILAKAGRRPEALADCDAGLKILRQTLGAQASYTQSMAAVCAEI